MKFGYKVDYGTRKSWLNFESDLEDNLNIVGVVRFPVGQQYTTIRDTAIYSMMQLTVVFYL